MHSLGGVPGEVRQVMASQAYFLSPVSSFPAISEALTAEAENGNRAAVKTKIDKFFHRVVLVNRIGIRADIKGHLVSKTAVIY